MAILFSDSLTYANGALSTANASYVDVSVGGSTIQISSNNAVTSNAANDARIRYTGISFTQAKQYATATMGSTFTTGGAGAGMGVVVKQDTSGADTCIRLVVSGAGWELARFNSGVFTSLSTALTSTTWAAADTATVVYDSSNGAWLVQKNGVTVTGGSGTDGSPLNNSGQSGICYSSIGNISSGVDAIEFGDFTASISAFPFLRIQPALPGSPFFTAWMGRLLPLGTAQVAGTTLALTGVVGTGSVGTLTPSNSVALTGVVGTGAVGTVVANDSIGLTGVAGTGSVGTLTPANSIGLTGVAGTGNTGTVVANDTIGVTGVSGTGQVGNVGQAPGLLGVQATGQVGTLVPNDSVPLTGVQGTGQVGTVSTGSDVTQALTGVVGTGAVGTLKANNSVALTGVAGTGAVGTVTAAFSLALTGVVGTGSVGTLGPNTVIALTGVQGSGQIGNVGIGGDVTLSLTGVQGSGQVGSVTVAGNATTGGGGITYRGKKRRRYVFSTAKKEFDLLKEVKEALDAEVQEIETATGPLSPEESKALASNIAIVAAKYEQAKKLADVYAAEISGIDEALKLAEEKMQAIIDEEIQYVVQLIAEMDDDGRIGT